MEGIRNTHTRIAVNPWTNKIKTRGEGILNEIMNKYLFDQLSQQSCQIPTTNPGEIQYVELAKQIKNKYQINNTIDQNLTELFQLKKKCTKIDEILSWIDLILHMEQPQSQSSNKSNPITDKNKQQTTPIDSSFIYLPAYSGTTLHQLLKDCSSLKEHRPTLTPANHHQKLKQFFAEIKNIQNLNQLLQNNIL